MKLLYISDHRFIANKNGEVFTTGQMGEKYFSRFTDYFHKITVIGVCEQSTNKNSSKSVEKINLEHPIIEYKLIYSNKMQGIKEVKSFSEKLVKNYDRIATKAPSLILNFVCNLSQKYEKKLLVEVVGCPWDSLWNHSWKGKIIAPYIWYMTKKSIKKTEYVTYVTDLFLQNRYPTKGESIGISDVEIMLPDDSVLEKRLNKISKVKTQNTIVLGTAGAIDVKYKGQEYVIEALAKLNKIGYNFEYHLAGGGDSSYLRKVAQKFNVLNKVKFLGSLPHSEIFSFFDNIDMYIQPSKSEGLPRALIEALSRATPCLGSKVGGIPELLDEKYLFSKGSVSEIINSLKNLLSEKDLKNVAKRNFKRSKKYNTIFLKKKRDMFLNKIF